MRISPPWERLRSQAHGGNKAAPAASGSAPAWTRSRSAVPIAAAEAGQEPAAQVRGMVWVFTACAG